MILSTIAWSAGSTAALPVETVLFILLICFVIYLPLNLIGAVYARRRTRETLSNIQSQISIKKPIPEKPFLKSFPVFFLIAGLLSFNCMILEMYYIYNSIWG